MASDSSAATAFGIVSQVAHILAEAVRDGREFTAEVSAGTTTEPALQPTGGYEIRITVQPERVTPAENRQGFGH
jgi:hypothetical protein